MTPLKTALVVFVSWTLSVGCADSPQADVALPLEQPSAQVADTELGLSAAVESAAEPQDIVPPPVADGCLRVATFNMALNRKRAGQLTSELRSGSQVAAQLSAIVQAVRPDLLLVNELDFDSDHASMNVLHDDYFAVAQSAAGTNTEPIEFPHRYTADVNTGVPSGIDLDGNGKPGQPTDCFGYGTFPGQYGMAVYSKHPIKNVRTFQNFLWKEMPNAALPKKANGDSYYSDEALDAFRLSSKSHWDATIETPEGPLHFLVSHPTPPAFDGPEDRNGRRNHDEIRLFADYVTGPEASAYLIDDTGKAGGLPEGTHFVIAGDLNADPKDGSSHGDAIMQLLNHARVQTIQPASPGGSDAADRQGEKNSEHQSDPAFDTGDFQDTSVGNLRADYVLPSRTLEVVQHGVFWPVADDVWSAVTNKSDHRMVWVDIRMPDSSAPSNDD